MRQALSIGIILMVISEMLAASSGLGFTIVQFQRGFAIPEMWSGILLLGLLGVALSLAFRVFENRALSSSPRVVQEDLAVDLPDDRDQLTTRSDPRFTQLRSHVYAQIQQAKRGGQPGRLTAGR
jgi:hypothetical protein